MFERLIALLVVVAVLLALGAAVNAGEEARPAEPDTRAPAEEPPLPPAAPVPGADAPEAERKGDAKGKPR